MMVPISPSPKLGPTRRAIAAGLAVAALLTASHPAVAQAPARPFPQQVTYGAGTILPSRFTRPQLDNHVRAYYRGWRDRYFVSAGNDAHGRAMYRIAFGPPGSANAATTVSEGQGWGMIIMALMAGDEPRAKTYFDGLWRFSRAFPSGGNARLMSWRITNGAVSSGNSSAFDGDADIALGLILAARQWPGAPGIDYGRQARAVLAAILASTVGTASNLPMLGDWVDPSGATYNQFTNRSSDMMPSSFTAFHDFAGVGRWATVATRSRSVLRQLQRNFAAATGLVPDFMVPKVPGNAPEPAPAGFLEGANDGFYFYNACRVPLRIGLDGLHYGNASSIAIAKRLSRWAEAQTGGQPTSLKAGYRLDGSDIAGNNYLSTAFLAPLGVAAMLHPARQRWLDRLYNVIRTSQQGYYEDTLTLLSMLILSGNFWNPSQP